MSVLTFPGYRAPLYISTRGRGDSAAVSPCSLSLILFRENGGDCNAAALPKRYDERTREPRVRLACGTREETTLSPIVAIESHRLKRLPRPVSRAGGSGSHVGQPCGALERHFLQSGAARYSRKEQKGRRDSGVPRGIPGFLGESTNIGTTPVVLQEHYALEGKGKENPRECKP
jgi:hypothetical protein